MKASFSFLDEYLQTVSIKLFEISLFSLKHSYRSLCTIKSGYLLIGDVK